MISNIRAVRITGIFHHDLTPVILSALKEAAVADYQIAAGRWITLRERKGIFGLMAEAKVLDHPVDMVTLLVAPEDEIGVMEIIIKSGELITPGRGSVFSEEVIVYRAHDLCRIFDKEGFGETGDFPLQRELTGICCIVQKGEGDAIARVLLDTGTCVPAISYGHGTGVRDKLGLLRITIPAEKEVVTMMASSYDAESLMNLLIATGKLNQPGKGFIYLYPIRAGQINMKVSQGMPRHAAGMEQIILTIDEMRGGSSWRARGSSLGIDSPKQDEFLHDLVSLTLTCDEGRGETLVKTAMRAGVPGATMTRTKHVCPPQSDSSRISPAREVYTMILARSQVESAVGIMEEHNALDDATHGQFCISSVPKAFTFISRR
jgi:hypothetical protein